ncbi:MAG: C4-dicarboxylate TRAP transporter substrate-binding protein [Myxococcota bacterium]
MNLRKSKRGKPTFAIALSVLFLVFLSYGSGGFSTPATPAPVATPPEYLLRFASIAPEGSPWHAYFSIISKRVEEQTKGRVAYKMYLGGALGSEIATIQLLQQGKLEGFGGTLTTLASAYNSPELNITELPFMFRNREEADYIVDEVLFVDISKILEKNGVILLRLVDAGWCSFASRVKPLENAGSFKKLRMRAQHSVVHQEMYKALGAYPVSIAATEVLSSLQGGAIDGVDSPLLFIYGAGWYTILRHITLTKHIHQVAAIVISKQFFNSLPEEIRRVIVDDQKKETLLGRKLLREKEDQILPVLVQKGVKVIEPSESVRDDMHKRLYPVYKKYRESSPYASKLLDKVNAALAEYRRRKPGG